jgi:hypothetical protein
MTRFLRRFCLASLACLALLAGCGHGVSSPAAEAPNMERGGGGDHGGM